MKRVLILFATLLFSFSAVCQLQNQSKINYWANAKPYLVALKDLPSEYAKCDSELNVIRLTGLSSGIIHHTTQEVFGDSLPSGIVTKFKLIPMGWYPQERYDTTCRVSMLCSWHGIVNIIKGYVVRQAQEYSGDAMPNGIAGYYDTRWEPIGYLDDSKRPLNKDVDVWNVKLLK
jgi:hypothetical protein